MNVAGKLVRRYVLKRFFDALNYRLRKKRYKFRQLNHYIRNVTDVHAGTRYGKCFFNKELKCFLKRSDKWVYETAMEYRKCTAAWRNLSAYQSPSNKTDGISKTLDVAEGFVLWAVVKHTRPCLVVEIGTQFGVSARLWKEALKTYVPKHELILCDLKDTRRLIDDTESTFYEGDARLSLPEIFATKVIDILHNDAHPYSLTGWSVREGLKQGIKNFTFHDVGTSERGAFRIKSTDMSTKEKLKHDLNWMECGAWERHVMGEIFDQRILSQDFVTRDNVRLGVFDSFLGLGVVLHES